MSYCKQFENDHENYSLYIHGYLLHWHHQQRQAGRLKHGKLLIAALFLHIVERKEWKDKYRNGWVYKGEVD